MRFYRQTLYLQIRDERTIFRQTGLIYSSDYSRINEVNFAKSRRSRKVIRSDPEFYAEDGIERYCAEFFPDQKDMETEITKDSKSCQPPCDEHFPILREKELNNRLFENYLHYQAKELVDHIKEFVFPYSDITDQEVTLLIDRLVDFRDVHSQHKFDVGKMRQKFHVTLKPKEKLKRQRHSKVHLHLKEKLEKPLTQFKDADIIQEMGDIDELGSLFVNPIILMRKNAYVKLVIDARYLNPVTDLTNYSWR